MKDLTIRPMTAEDAPLVAAWMVTLPLWQRYGLTVESAQTQFKRALIAQDILLVADQDAENRAAGFTWCLPKGGFGLSAYLKLIGVHQSGAGIGAALLD